MLYTVHYIVSELWDLEGMFKSPNPRPRMPPSTPIATGKNSGRFGGLNNSKYCHKPREPDV